MDTCAIEGLFYASFYCLSGYTLNSILFLLNVSPFDVEKPTAAGSANDLHSFGVLASFSPMFCFIQLGTRPFLTCVYENIHSDGSTFLLLAN